MFHKIFSDPLYGFISINSPELLKLIDHPYFQKLRRISQLGLASFVYPGANHDRFSHSIGCLYLMTLSLDILQKKDIVISPKEKLATQMSALLHDLGHGPFSHALEFYWIKGVSHEEISLDLIKQLNIQMDGLLDICIQLLENKYPRSFFNTLISGQLDVDRLDYIQRDSYYTGVKEGQVNAHRILQLLDVVNDELVLAYKGIYSLESYLVARRIMYWQVYLHKTVLSAEFTLGKIFERAQSLTPTYLGTIPKSLAFFLKNKPTKTDYIQNPNYYLQKYILLDDTDIYVALKNWTKSKDFVLKNLSCRLLYRKLLKVKWFAEPYNEDKLKKLQQNYAYEKKIDLNQASYFIFAKAVKNNAYNIKKNTLKIMERNGNVSEISIVADTENIKALCETVNKYFLFYPEDANLLIE